MRSLTISLWNDLNSAAMADVSIIIPVHNRVELLRQTLISCAIQTYEDCEVLVVDDGSEQDVSAVVEWVRTVLGGPCLFRYIRQPRRGAPAARNCGVREARGRFVQFLDSDDLIHPQKIETQRNYLRDWPELDMVFGLDEFFRKIPGDMAVLWNSADEPALERFLWDDAVWHTGSPLWKLGAVKRIGPWDEGLLCFQDWEYHIRALCRGIKYAHIPVVLQYIRDHQEPRISNSPLLTDRERSKFAAAIAAGRALTAGSAWSRRRGDALAVFLLELVLNLRQNGEHRTLMAALARAAWYANSLRLRAAAVAMLGVTAMTKIKKRGRRDSILTAYQVASRFWALPTHSGNWKRSRASAEVPSTLLRALEIPSAETAAS
jgi:glycosyltransferase involved in cell wall biosynthesis